MRPESPRLEFMSTRRSTTWRRTRLAALLDRIPDSDYRGMNNPAALCYLTSVLQVLYMTPRFPEAVRRKSAEHSVFLDPHLERLFSVLEKHTADIHNITRALGITEAEVYEQRDAAEYFQKILSGTSPEASKMFRGKLWRSVTCCTCGTGNKVEAAFWTLPLPLRPSRRQQPPWSLKMAFESVFMPSTVTGQDQIYCDRCKARQDASIACRWKRLPQVLTLQLERFWFSPLQQRYEKITCGVDVPQKLHTEGCCYQLYAHINHAGSLAGGHYTATIWSHQTAGWYHFDDAFVRLLHPHPEPGESPTESHSAYLLMYRKERHASNMDDATVAGGGAFVHHGSRKCGGQGLWADYNNTYVAKTVG